jgi:hypothetical protein
MQSFDKNEARPDCCKRSSDEELFEMGQKNVPPIGLGEFACEYAGAPSAMIPCSRTRIQHKHDDGMKHYVIHMYASSVEETITTRCNTR